MTAGLKAGEVGGVVTIADSFLRGSVVQLEVGVAVTLAAVGVGKVKELIDKRRNKDLSK